MRRPSPRYISEELKAKIITEALIPGASIREIAKRHEIDRSTIDTWLRERRLVEEAALLPGASHAYLCMNLPEPERSVLLAKMEKDRAAAAAEAAEERMRFLSIIESLSSILANRG